mmetsp:Transcript_14688/g.16829  ORF Transcript_14688/g.16829 Transcript_14688/m.16829 type:complete len:458 (+) Transcript_14688:138-1511(+)
MVSPISRQSHSESESGFSTISSVDDCDELLSSYQTERQQQRQSRQCKSVNEKISYSLSRAYGPSLPSLFIVVSLLMILQDSYLFLSVVTASTIAKANKQNRDGGQHQRRNFSGRRISFVYNKAKIVSQYPRGGDGDPNIFEATIDDNIHDDDDHDDEVENEDKVNDIRQHPEYDKLLAFRMKQQVLLQLRATALSEALVGRGVPIPSLRSVSTLDGKVPPEKTDWDCALNTEQDPKHCLISYEPEVGAKLIVPMGLGDTDKWITLREFNRLRRDDPSKVEPMWNDKYAVLSSWFCPNSRYSLLQHVGLKGILLNRLLEGNTLSGVVAMALVVWIVIFMPVIEYVVGRFLVSGFVWMKWSSWMRFVHVGLPFKLLIAQQLFSQLYKVFAKLVTMVKERLVNLECRILEETIPLTLGVPTILDEMEEEVIENLQEKDEDDESVSGYDYDDDDDDDGESF